MLVDLHVKSSAEGVSIDLDTIFAKAKSAGIDALAFCETLSTANCRATLDAAAKAGITAFIGVEIPSDKGILLGFAPVIDDFYLAEEWRQLTEYATPPAHQVIAMFDEMGGAVVASRPYDLTIPYNMGDLIFTLDNVHGVEVFNSRCGQVQCDFALEAAKFMGIPTCGGTDPKGNGEGFGKYATFFENDLTTQQQFVNALRDGEYWAVQFGATPEQKRTPRSDDSRGGRDSRGGGRDSRGGGRGGDSRRDGGRGGRSGGKGGGGRGGRSGGRRN